MSEVPLQRTQDFVRKINERRMKAGRMASRISSILGIFPAPERSRKYFGALLVGYYGQEGLLFAGRVGTGFSERALEALHGGMQKIRHTTCPL